jgi:16S rRNA (uracil1498-N3)-methyltransferase
MIFHFHKDSGKNKIIVEGELYRHIFRARRVDKSKTLTFSNLLDGFIYEYSIDEIGKKDAVCDMVSKTKSVKKGPFSHLIWCIVDLKTIQRTLPFLNELNLEKLTFVYCFRSQKNFRIDLEKLNKILINSSCQCGRVKPLEIEVLSSLKEVLLKYSHLRYLDFGGETDFKLKDGPVLVGPEGGFSNEDRELLNASEKLGLNEELVLKSETAAIALCAKK